MTTRMTQFALAAAMAVSTGAFVAGTTAAEAGAAKPGCKFNAASESHTCTLVQQPPQKRGYRGTFPPPRRAQNFGPDRSYAVGRDSEGGNGSDSGGEGAGGRGGAAGAGFSDIRLKRDIEALGTLSNGLTLYRFKYLWSDTDMVGVMAQEVLNVAPDAVITGEDGFYRVNYEKLGISMMTFDEWKTLMAEIDRLPQAA